MTLENLVPPLDLCKQIPAGHFEDSALVWYNDGFFWKIAERYTTQGVEVSAPTPAEIMCSLSRYEPVNVTQWRSGQVSVVIQKDGAEYEEISENYATAALKLWLDVEAGK